MKRKIILGALLLGLCLLPACNTADNAATVSPSPESSDGQVPITSSDKEEITLTTDGNGEETTAGDAHNAAEHMDLVAIYVGNDLYTVLDFHEAQVFEVNQGNGVTNEITLTGDSVYMSHSSCDNQDCVQQGDITLENLETRVLMNWVICLPNGVTIELVPDVDTSAANAGGDE